MDVSLKNRIKNQIFKFEANFDFLKDGDASFTLDYECGRYRQNELVGLIRDTVPYFALTEEEIATIDKSDWNRNSFTRISDANESSKGDYGELLLFLILSIFYDTPKFVTKARLRSTTREQIKGFDCAHFSVVDNEVTLWLGEAKFHKDISGAISKALSSLNDHLNDSEKIKSELKILGGEIEINKEIDKINHDLLKEYVIGGRSLDRVNIAVPVLCTYDSTCISDFCGNTDASLDSDEFIEQMKNEINQHYKTIHEKKWPSKKNIKIVFFVMPFESVSDLKSNIGLVEKSMKF